MTTPTGSQNLLKPSETLLEDDILGIYQQLQEIAETIILPTDETKLTQNFEDNNNFNEIEGFYKEIEQKEKQIKILIEISSSLLTKTKEKILNKEQEIHYIEKNVENSENEISQGKERLAESTDMIKSLNDRKEQLESFLNDLEGDYEKTQENLFRSQEEFISLGEYKRKFKELNSLLAPNNELLSFYKQTNEDLKKEHKFYKGEYTNNKSEIDVIRKKLAILLENYEKTISKQTNLNKQKLYLQDQISKIKDDIKLIQQMNTILIKEIEKDQLKRIKGVPRINSLAFLSSNNVKETPKRGKTVFQKPSNETNNSKMKIFNERMSIDFLLENEEKEKTSQENLKTPLLINKKKDDFCEKIDEKAKKLEQAINNNEKLEDSGYENFSNFKNSLEINIVSQKSEEFAVEADNSKYFKPDFNKISLSSSKSKKKKKNVKENENSGGFFNFWVIGGLTMLISVVLVIKTQIKAK